MQIPGLGGSHGLFVQSADALRMGNDAGWYLSHVWAAPMLIIGKSVAKFTREMLISSRTPEKTLCQKNTYLADFDSLPIPSSPSAAAGVPPFDNERD